MIMHDRASSEMKKFKPSNDVYFTPHLQSLPELQKNQMLNGKITSGEATTQARTIGFEDDPSIVDGGRMNVNSSMRSLNEGMHKTVGYSRSSLPTINAKNS